MDDEEQCDSRYTVKVDGSCRSGTGRAMPVRVTNLSAHGCRFDSDGRRIGADTIVTMSFGRIGSFEALVQWCDGLTHGVRFEPPLPPEVLDHVRLTVSAAPALVAERVSVTG